MIPSQPVARFLRGAYVEDLELKRISLPDAQLYKEPNNMQLNVNITKNYEYIIQVTI